MTSRPWDGANVPCAIVLSNKFPVRVAAIVRHKYSSDSDYTNVWSPIEPDATTPASLAWIAKFTD